MSPPEMSESDFNSSLVLLATVATPEKQPKKKKEQLD